MIRAVIARCWDAAWFAPAQPLALAIFRIGFGALWLQILVASAPHWTRWYGKDGVVPFAWLGDQFFSRPSLLSISAADGWTTAFYGFALTAAFAFTVGFRTRAATIALYLAVVSMVDRDPTVTHGEDLVARSLLFFACFAPMGSALSVDALLRSRAGVPVQDAGAIWPQRLMQVSIAFIYLFSLPAKPSDDGSWIQGNAIYYVMVSMNWGRIPELAPLFYSGPLSALLSWSTLLIEGAFPFLVWWHRTRYVALGSLALLQAGIALLVGHVLNFNVSVLISFLLFVPDPAYLRLAEKLRRGVALRRPRAAPVAVNAWAVSRGEDCRGGEI